MSSDHTPARGAVAAPPKTLLGKIRQRLFTREDPIHFHKTFGIICLLSFVYRYFIVLPVTGTLGFNGSWFDWATMCAHMGLSSSSLIFHVIKRRKIHRPMVIWEEYRLHAIVFTLRCFSVFVFNELCPSSVPNGTRRLLTCVLVLAHHLVVDDITRKYGSRGTTTVRVDNSSRPLTRLVLRGYSLYQFMALGSHLVPHERTSDLAFNTLIAIQSSAFMMTLYRKALVSEFTHGFVYSSCLLLSGSYILLQLWSVEFVVGIALAFYLRCTWRMDKYALWTGFCALSTPAVRSLVVRRVAALASRHSHWMPDVHGVQAGFSARFGDPLRRLVGVDPLAQLRRLNDALDLEMVQQHLSGHYHVLSDKLSTNYNGLTESLSTNYNGLTESLSTNYNGLTESLSTNYNGLTESLSTNYNGLQQTIGGAVPQFTELVAASPQHKFAAIAVALLTLVAWYWVVQPRKSNNSNNNNTSTTNSNTRVPSTTRDITPRARSKSDVVHAPGRGNGLPTLEGAVVYRRRGMSNISTSPLSPTSNGETNHPASPVRVSWVR